MVVGIDSYHDSAAKGRSVSAFVCSVNRTMSKYYSKMCFNHQYGELLDGIASCMAGKFVILGRPISFCTLRNS